MYAFLVTWPLFIESWANKLSVDPAAGVPGVDITRLFCMVILPLTVLYQVTRGKRLRTDIIIVTTALYSIYFLLEIFLNDIGTSLSTGFAGLFQVCIIPCIIYFALINLKDVLDRKYLIYAVLIAGIYISGSGVVEFIVGHNVFGPANDLSVDRMAGIYRTNGPFWDAISYAGIVLCLVPFTYWVLKEKYVNKSFAQFCLILFSLGALAEFSRIVGVAFVLVMGLLYLGKDRKNILLILFAVMTCAVLAYLLSDVIFASRLYKNRLAVGSEGRFEQYLGALRTFWHSPLFGNGYGMYGKTHRLPMHNSFLKVLVDFGLLGVLSYIPVVWSLLFHGFRESVKVPSLHRAKMCLIITVLLVSSTIDFLSNGPFIMALYIFTAIMNMDLKVLTDRARLNPLSNGAPMPANILASTPR